MLLHVEYVDTFFDLSKIFLEAINLDDPFGLSLSLHHFDFNLWIMFYDYCKFVSESYAKTNTLTFCF